MAWRWRRTSLGGEADRAAFRALHNASLASPALREGLTTASAERSVRHLRALLGTPAQVMLSDGIHKAFEEGRAKLASSPAVTLLQSFSKSALVE